MDDKKEEGVREDKVVMRIIKMYRRGNKEMNEKNMKLLPIRSTVKREREREYGQKWRTRGGRRR